VENNSRKYFAIAGLVDEVKAVMKTTLFGFIPRGFAGLLTVSAKQDEQNPVLQAGSELLCRQVSGVFAELLCRPGNLPT
jgi:hypothetical protein